MEEICMSMNLADIQNRIAQKQRQLQGLGQTDGGIDSDKAAIRDRMAEDIVVPLHRQGYVPTKRTLLSDAFTFTTLTGLANNATIAISTWAKYTIPNGEKLIFAPFKNDYTSGYFWARINSDATGATAVNECTVTIDILDPREQRNYGTVIQESSRVLNTSNPADRDERTYVQNPKAILGEDGDKIEVKLEGANNVVRTIDNSGCYFAFEIYELIRAK